MVEVEFNMPVDVAALARFFARCGWTDPTAEAGLEWALANSEDWVTCMADGEMVGFGRTCRFMSAQRVVFDVLVDDRYEDSPLRGEIVRLLTANVSCLEDVVVFTGGCPSLLSTSGTGDTVPMSRGIDDAPADAYLGAAHPSGVRTAGQSTERMEGGDE